MLLPAIAPWCQGLKLLLADIRMKNPQLIIGMTRSVEWTSWKANVCLLYFWNGCERFFSMTDHPALEDEMEKIVREGMKIKIIKIKKEAEYNLLWKHHV